MPAATTFGKRGAPRAPAYLAPARLASVAAAPAAVASAESPAKSWVSRFAPPWLTCMMLLALTAIYAVEAATSAGSGHVGSPSHTTLMKLGGLSGDLVFHSGQVWRVLTAPMLHVSTAHLIGNGVALLLVGRLLEPIVGWRWFAAIYAIGGLGGTVGSLLLNPGDILGVGASGAIMGVLACALVLSFHVACHEKSRRIRILSIRVMIPAMLPVASSTGGHVDYSAHLGGALAGMAVGFLLQVVWAENKERPPFEPAMGWFARGFAGVSLAVFCLAASLPTSAPAQVATAGLIPIDDVPDSLASGMARADQLLEQYPLDPRSHIFAGVRAAKAHDEAGEVRQFALALESPLIEAPEMPHGEGAKLRPAVVGMYLELGDEAAARRFVGPLCTSPPTDQDKVMALVAKAKLCEAGG